MPRSSSQPCTRRLELLAKRVERQTDLSGAQHPRRVYVVELSKAGGSGYGLPSVYVGQSYLSAEERFQQHLDGYRASRFVRKHGVQLRPDLYEMLPAVATVPESEELERAVADILRDCGYTVFGGH